MKFTIDGREYESYQLSNNQITYLLSNSNISKEEKDFLMDKVLERFKSCLCQIEGETDDDVFARFFSDYVNKCPNDFNKATDKMARDHRYLQNEMFIFFMSYVQKLSKAFENGNYDDRNRYACKTSNMIIKALNKENWPY